MKRRLTIAAFATLASFLATTGTALAGASTTPL